MLQNRKVPTYLEVKNANTVFDNLLTFKCFSVLVTPSLGFKALREKNVATYVCSLQLASSFVTY